MAAPAPREKAADGDVSPEQTKPSLICGILGEPALPLQLFYAITEKLSWVKIPCKGTPKICVQQDQLMNIWKALRVISEAENTTIPQFHRTQSKLLGEKQLKDNLDMKKIPGLNLSKTFSCPSQAGRRCKAGSWLHELGPFVVVLMLLHTVIKAGWMKAEY